MSLYRKQYIPVRVVFSEEGIMFPRAVVWTNGQEYPVDRVKKKCSERALKTDGYEDRYTVEICGQERYLFFEHNPEPYERPVGRWFVEVRDYS